METVNSPSEFSSVVLGQVGGYNSHGELGSMAGIKAHKRPSVMQDDVS